MMNSLVPLLLLIVGFVALILGANWLVNGATSVGIRAKLSPLIIGLTIVAFGTSLPEMIVNVFSCAKGSPGLAIGNIIGSNTMNILLILGVSALIWPIDVNRISIRRDIPAGFVATLAITLMANYFFTRQARTINWVEGIVLLLMGFAYLLLTMLKNDPKEEAENVQEAMPWGKTILALLAGIVGLYIGGELVSRNAQILAHNWGMSDSTIGLTVVATATSLPELITSIVAALKKNSGIAIGNVLGSNILNIFMVLGISSIITPLPFEPMMNQQLMILFAANILMLLFVFTGKGRKISRWEGAFLTLGYIGFMWFSLAMQ
ncbi:MAG: calcium/sodium antiporter [Bacteroidales bacterium]|jgi:cation:H+ antiporter|nr:calcium/sodium antiporter [Bacteroidales bacterium]